MCIALRTINNSTVTVQSVVIHIGVVGVVNASHGIGMLGVGVSRWAVI